MFGDFSLFRLLQDERMANVLYLFILVLAVTAGVALDRHLQNRVPKDDPDRAPFGKWMNPSTTLLLLALVVGASLRFYGLSWGLPRPYHPDEFEEARFLQNMMRSGSINPNYSQQPPLILYLSWPISLILKFLEIFDGNTLVRNVLAGRIVNAVAGTASLYLVYTIGKRLSSPFSGAFAASLLAVAPLHVTNSRYMKQDALLVMFVLGCVLAVLKAVDSKRARYLYLAGALAGFAAASKYSGLACAGILLSAPWLRRERFSLRPDPSLFVPVLLSGVAMAAAFFLSMPYVLFSSENFEHLLNGMAFESKHARTGHHGLAIDPWRQLWMFHFSRSVIPGMSLLPVLAALLAGGIILRRGNTRLLWLLALVAMFYVPAEWARSKPPPQPDRYVLACVPFLALLAAELTRESWLRFGRASGTIAAALLLVLPLGRSLQLASELKVDTREQMTDWLAENLPPGTKILKTGGAAYLPRVPQALRSVSARKVIGRDKSNLISTLRESGYDYIMTTSISTGRFSIQNLPEGNDRPLAVRGAMRQIESSFPVAKRIAPRWGSYGFHNPTITLYSLKGDPAARASLGQQAPLSEGCAVAGEAQSCAK